MEEATTPNKIMTLAGMIFNAAGEVLKVSVSTTDLLIPSVTVDDALTPEEKMGKLVETMNELTGVNTGLGDVIYDDYGSDSNQLLVFMAFLEDYDNINEDLEWMPLHSIDHEDNTNIMYILHIHLINTLFNTQKMRMGNCYENIVTGETYYVIHVINDNMRNKNFLILESTMAQEPIVLPSDAFWGMSMRWVSHLRFMEMVQYTPTTMAERAKYYFINAHNMTNHRYDGKPYSFHLSGVVEQFNKFKHLIPEEHWDHVEAELWGHDGIEDARLTFNDVKDVLNEQIAEGCYVMTNDKGRNRKTRAGQPYYDGLAADEFGEFKKLCDRLANMENSISNGHTMGGMYTKEFDSFETTLRTHGDTYKEMWDTLKTLING